jgi:hypothetical protein
VQKSYPVWYFDATGDIFKKVKTQTDPLIYSVVFHDMSNKTILPICDFLTTSHGSDQISIYLKILKDKLAFYGDLIPPFIVTDFSYALINAVMITFNMTTIGHYLEWCFKYQIEGKSDLKNCMKTRLYLCSTHILKLIIKKTKKIQISENVKEFFIRCFGLLQNSTTLNQFDFVIFNMINIFYNPYYEESLSVSLNFLREKLKSFENIIQENLIEEENEDQQFKVFEDTGTIENIKQNSPFGIYYSDLIEQYQKKLNLHMIKKLKVAIGNEFYCPALFNLIEEKLYLMPLWSGLMIGEYQAHSTNEFVKTQTRFTNNFVESYFKNLKFSTLNEQNNLVTSELAAKCFTKIKATFIEIYNRSEFQDGHQKLFLQIKEKNDLSKCKEKWKKKENIKRLLKEAKGFTTENRKHGT